MKQTISRTITISRVTYVILNIKDGEPEMSENKAMEYTGKLTEEDAQKSLVKTVDKKAMVVGIEYETNTYEMLLDEFLERANIVNKGDDK